MVRLRAGVLSGKILLQGFFIGSLLGISAGLLEPYVVILLASPPDLYYTRWAMVHLMAVSGLINGFVMAALTAALVGFWALRAFLTRKEISHQGFFASLLSLFFIFLLKIALSGYVNERFLPGATNLVSLVFNSGFLVAAVLIFRLFHRWFSRRAVRLARAMGIAVAFVAISSISALGFFGNVEPLHRGQSWRSVEPKLSKAPNVILILVDTLRADHLSAYGYERPTSPVFDALAKEGVLFENAYSHASWTIPSIATLFTSVQESIHGMTHVAHALPDESVTLAEILRDSGYTTAFISSNEFVSRQQNYTQGFDYILQTNTLYERLHTRNFQPPYRLYLFKFLTRLPPWVFDFLDRGVNLPLEYLINEAGANRKGLFSPIDPLEGADRVGKADWMYEYARGYLDHMLDQQGYDLRQNKFFLYLHYFDPHDPYRAPARYQKLFDPDYEGEYEEIPPDLWTPTPLDPRRLQNMVAQYDGEIRFFDTYLNELVRFLKARDLYDETLIIITSDHGEAFFEHGNYKHGGTVFDEEVKIPLFMRFPGAIPEGLRISDLAGLIDVTPTILDILGVEISADGREFQGNSLLPVIQGKARRGELYGEVTPFINDTTPEAAAEGTTSLAFFVSLDPNGQKLKLISEYNGGLFGTQDLTLKGNLLFDLSKDRKERENLYERDAALPRVIEERLVGRQQKIWARARLAAPEAVEFDSETLERLKSLGYIK